MKSQILAVDDDKNFRDGLRRLLRANDLSVITAENGYEALELLKREPIDVVLADLQMPQMAGVQLLTKIKADPVLMHIPVIMVSARDEVEGVVECLKLGADDYIHKPFDQTLLMTRVRSSLNRKLSEERERQHLRDLTEQKQHVDQLLHALFPQPIIDELKSNKVVQPQRYERATVLFADIVGFTGYCSDREPEEVLGNLQELVESFEMAALRYNMQKIKTIGDAFMCVGGLWDEQDMAAENATRCALEMTELAPNLGAGWQVRCGVHMGPLIAGVIGLHRYQFDVWGATVNVAARVQAASKPGTVLVSGPVAEALPPSLAHEDQGPVTLKGTKPMNLHMLRPSDQASAELAPAGDK